MVIGATREHTSYAVATHLLGVCCLVPGVDSSPGGYWCTADEGFQAVTPQTPKRRLRRPSRIADIPEARATSALVEGFGRRFMVVFIQGLGTFVASCQDFVSVRRGRNGGRRGS